MLPLICANTHYRNLSGTETRRPELHYANRVPQRSVQIVLIFRLLLKITVDWPSNAILKCL